MQTVGSNKSDVTPELLNKKNNLDAYHFVTFVAATF